MEDWKKHNSNFSRPKQHHKEVKQRLKEIKGNGGYIGAKEIRLEQNPFSQRLQERSKPGSMRPRGRSRR